MNPNYLEMFRKFLNSIGPIPESEWQDLAQILSIKTFEKGEMLVPMGEICREIGFIVSGLFKGYYLTADGGVYIRHFAAENSLVGPYSSILRNEPSNANLEALEDSTLLMIPYDRFTKLYGRHACWQELGRKMAENFFMIRENREFQFLTQDAKARYASFTREFKNIQHRITQNDIAAYIGVSPVSLSRLLNSK